PAQRRTSPAHLPPDGSLFPLQAPAGVPPRAADVGPACREFIEHRLGDRPLDRLRSAHGILRLSQRSGAPRLDAACARALTVGEYRYHTVKTILAHALEGQPLPGFTPLRAPLATAPPRPAPPATTF